MLPGARVSPPAPMAGRPGRPLLDDSLLVPHRDRDQRRDDEEDEGDDRQSEARLQHRANLVGAEAERIVADGDGGGGARGRDAARAGDTAIGGDASQVVDAGDQAAHEAEVDEGDEPAVAPDRADLDHRHETPGHGEGGDDEEDEDVGGRELVLRVIDVDEVGLGRILVGAHQRRYERVHVLACP